jgi:predicted nucleic acid-binding protein
LKQLLDTSVLVATVIAEHQHHVPSLAVYTRCEKRNSCCSVHSLAETYAAVTRLPGNLRLSGDQALLFLRDVQTRLTAITLDEEDYFATIAAAAAANISGGTVYDTLIARCALKARADVLYTWNISDFVRLGPEVASMVRTPGFPSSEDMQREDRLR